MWSGIIFETAPIVDQATSLINQFMPLVYIIGGIVVFGLVMLIVIALAKRSVS